MAYRPLECTSGFREGFWWNNSQVDAVTAGLLPPEAVTAFPCPEESACGVTQTNQSTCATGYSGTFCGLCEAGFGMGGSGACSRCWHPAASWALLVTLLAGFGTAGFYGIRRAVASRQRLQLPDGGYSRDTTVTAKILVNFLQTVSFLGDFELQWPATASTFFAAAATASGFTSESAFVSCALGWPPVARFVAAAVLVPLVVAVPAVVISAMAALHRRQEFQRADEDEGYVPVPLSLAGVTPLNLFTTVALFLLFLIYPMVTRQAFQMLVCAQPVGGMRLLVADLNVVCGSELHGVLVALAWFVIGTVTLGFPAAVVACLWPYRSSLRSVKAQRRFGFLYKGYRDDRFWYESIVLLRKASVASVSVLLRITSPTLQLWAGILAQLVFLGLHVGLQPYEDKVQSWLEMGCIIAAVLVLVLGQGLTIADLGGGSAPVLSVAIMAVALAAVGTCVLVIVYDVYRAFARAAFAQQAMAAWSRGGGSEGAAAATASEVEGELADEALEAPGKSALKQRMTLFRSVRALLPRGGRQGGAAGGPGEKGEAERQSRRDAHGFRLEDLPAVRSAGKGQLRGFGRRRSMRWRTNSFQASVSGPELPGRAASAGSGAGLGDGAVVNPLAGLRRTKSGIATGVGKEVHQTGLVRDRAATRGAATGREDEGSRAGRSSSRAGGGMILPNSPWASVRDGRTALAVSAAREAQASRRKREEVLVSAGLRAQRRELETRWREAVHPVWGTTYWYNRQTRQITWELPSELEALAEKEAQELAEWTRKEHPRKRIAYWAHPSLGKRWHRPPGVPLRSEEAWWRAQLPGSGVPYFVHLLTRQTEWERPAGYVYTPPQLMHESLRPLVAALQEPGAGGAAAAGAGSGPDAKAAVM